MKICPTPVGVPRRELFVLSLGFVVAFSNAPWRELFVRSLGLCSRSPLSFAAT